MVDDDDEDDDEKVIPKTASGGRGQKNVLKIVPTTLQSKEDVIYIYLLAL